MRKHITIVVLTVTMLAFGLIARDLAAELLICGFPVRFRGGSPLLLKKTDTYGPVSSTRRWVDTLTDTHSVTEQDRVLHRRPSLAWQNETLAQPNQRVPSSENVGQNSSREKAVDLPITCP